MNAGSARPPQRAGTDASYKEALAWLFGTQLFGIKLGLANVERLLCALDLPSPDQRIIHVAGTNGKGSVCAMADAICRAAGYRSGLFTSPHLVTFRERILVNGVMVSEAAVAAGLTSIRELVADWDPHPTFFEITTALALQHFAATRCQIVVLETGMGGRLDATNAVQPVVSVLTPIDLDHQKWLGQTLAEIASEKAGIIKPHVPVISAEQPDAAAAVIRAQAAAAGAPLRFVARHESLPTSLSGEHQKQNAALAVAAMRAGGIGVDPAAVEAGLANVAWPARFQRWNDKIIIDGAHNPAGARILAQTWREQFGDDRAVLVLGILCDKDAAGIIRALAPIASEVLLPNVRSERAFSPDQLAAAIHAAAPRLRTEVASSLADALSRLTNTRERVLITGSLHFAGEALAVLRGDTEQLDDCLQ